MGRAKKQMITVRHECDTERLYGSLDEAIAYLQEVQRTMPTVQLAEAWQGYDYMDMVFEERRKETDAEFNERRSMERERDKLQRAEQRRKLQRAKDMKKLNELKAKLGVR